MERTTTTGFSGEPFTTSNNFEPPLMKKRSNKDKDKDKNQRRFSDEQIKLLETMFELETRLEPKKKVELARELGLQPRQVAIWFQNKRARWKSKQIEQDLRALRAEYETLVSKFEVLKQEKQSLISQLEKLNDVLKRAHDEDSKDRGSSSKSTDPEGDLVNLNIQEGLEEREAFENTNNNINVENMAHHNDELVANTSQQADISLASLENWYRHNLGSVLDQSQAQWLNYWF